MTKSQSSSTPRVGLFATCLVDLFRPSVGFATAQLLESAGCTVEVPDGQTCCGQPAYNNGDLADTRNLARQTIEAFEHCDFVVVPSGSCAGQIRKYPELFADDRGWRRRAEDLAQKTHEVLAFLTDIMGMESVSGEFKHTATYHDSCSSLRQMGVRDQPRRLLAGVDGLELREMDETEVCCGFGGTFCVKYPEISGRLVDDKVNNILATGAETVLAGDLGCLMNIVGRLRRRGENVHAYHTVEVLAGMADGPGIGEDESAT
jgi:L-lactate dehydrogenase complex protein LldE